MNNSKLALDSFEPTKPVDRKPKLRGMESRLVDIIESLKFIIDTKEWQTLKDEIFDGVLESLEKRLMVEAKKAEKDIGKMDSLNGQIVWAKKYSDLDKLVTVYRQELVNVRRGLDEKDD